MPDLTNESVFTFDHTNQPINELMSLANTNIWFDGKDLLYNFAVDNNGVHYGLLAVSVNQDNQKRLLRGSRSANLQKPLYRSRNVVNGISETPLTFAIDFVLIKQEDSWYDSLGQYGNPNNPREDTPESMRKTWIRVPWEEWTLREFNLLFGGNDFKKLIFGAEKLRGPYEIDGKTVQIGETDSYYSWGTNGSDKYNVYGYNNAGYDINDNSPLYYNVIPMIGSETNLSVFEGYFGYITVNFQCDAPHGWVDLHKNITYTSNTDADYLSGYLNSCDILNQDEEYAIYPIVTFKGGSHENGDGGTVVNLTGGTLKFAESEDVWTVSDESLLANNLSTDTLNNLNNAEKYDSYEYSLKVDFNSYVAYIVITTHQDDFIETKEYLMKDFLQCVNNGNIWFPYISTRGTKNLGVVVREEIEPQVYVDKNVPFIISTLSAAESYSYEIEIDCCIPCSAKETYSPDNPQTSGDVYADKIIEIESEEEESEGE